MVRSLPIRLRVACPEHACAQPLNIGSSDVYPEVGGGFLLRYPGLGYTKWIPQVYWQSATESAATSAGERGATAVEHASLRYVARLLIYNPTAFTAIR